MNKEKNLFQTIFILFFITLIALPFLVSFNEVLTKIFEQNRLYIFIQDNIVPWEAKVIGAILLPFGYEFGVAQNGPGIVVNGLFMKLTWNCLGWQSLLLFLATWFVGFRGRYTKLSIAEAVGIGLLGTFWLNIARIVLTVLLAIHIPAVFRIVFHDYLAAISTIIWLFFFWYFAYSFVLEPKQPN